jgi:hypothetical protein
MENDFWENVGYLNSPTGGALTRALYLCSSCKEFHRAFYLKFGPNAEYVMKVGQFPPWEIEIDKEMELRLGEYSEYYMKGLITESQGYGIGAFAYYRRIVEEVIDELLADISDLLAGEEKERYQETLKKAGKSTVTQDKIEIVKDLLPPILRPGGMNPLSVLHSTLSEGLHENSDEECMDLAMTLREIMLFLVHQLSVSKKSSLQFTERMRKLLDKRSNG